MELTTVKFALTYWLIALFHNRSHAFTVLPGKDAFYSIVDGSHACKVSLVLLAPTQLQDTTSAHHPYQKTTFHQHFHGQPPYSAM